MSEYVICILRYMCAIYVTMKYNLQGVPKIYVKINASHNQRLSGSTLFYNNYFYIIFLPENALSMLSVFLNLFSDIKKKYYAALYIKIHHQQNCLFMKPIKKQ